LSGKITAATPGVVTLGRARRARRIAAAAVYGGGGIGLVGAGVAGVLVNQARQARRAIPRASTPAPVSDGTYRTEQDGVPVVLAVLGDSTAAGYGVALPRETTGALLAAGLAEVVERPVQLVCAAAVGARSEGLHAQVSRVLAEDPDVAVVMIGSNDVTNRIRTAEAVGHLDLAVRRLIEHGVEVVVGTCPDLGTVEPIPHPLRWLARRLSRQLAAAQTIAVVEAGARSVSLGDLLGPEFASSPAEMFSADRFHPSATGYAAAAAALLPSVATALGVSEPSEDRPQAARAEAVLPLADAAVEAAETAGTEVTRTELAGRERGARGRWAALRHRIRRFTTEPTDPQPDHQVVDREPVEASAPDRVEPTR